MNCYRQKVLRLCLLKPLNVRKAIPVVHIFLILCKYHFPLSHFPSILSTAFTSMGVVRKKCYNIFLGVWWNFVWIICEMGGKSHFLFTSFMNDPQSDFKNFLTSLLSENLLLYIVLIVYFFFFAVCYTIYIQIQIISDQTIFPNWPHSVFIHKDLNCTLSLPMHG